jgi:hypothetical protein
MRSAEGDAKNKCNGSGGNPKGVHSNEPVVERVTPVIRSNTGANQSDLERVAAPLTPARVVSIIAYIRGWRPNGLTPG